MAIEGLLVDPEDEHYLTKYAWRAFHTRGLTYVRARPRAAGGRISLFLHNIIMNAPPGVEVDHRNGNGLDNRRANLRLATRSRNNSNRKLQGGTSPFKGVSWHKQAEKWRAQITDGKAYHLGLFISEEDAARAYDAAARLRFGEFARCNFKAAK